MRTGLTFGGLTVREPRLARQYSDRPERAAPQTKNQPRATGGVSALAPAKVREGNTPNPRTTAAAAHPRAPANRSHEPGSGPHVGAANSAADAGARAASVVSAEWGWREAAGRWVWGLGLGCDRCGGAPGAACLGFLPGAVSRSSVWPRADLSRRWDGARARHRRVGVVVRFRAGRGRAGWCLRR